MNIERIQEVTNDWSSANWKVIEFDQHAIDSYNAIHGTQFQTSDIRNVHAADLELVERERVVHTYVFLSMSGLELGGERKRDEKRFRDTVWTLMGSRTDP